MTDYKDLPYDQLKTLHREIGGLIANKRQETLDQLRIQISELGFTAEDLVPKKAGRKNGVKKYQDPDNLDNVYGGKGPKPPWLQEALDGGRQLDEFLIA